MSVESEFREYWATVPEEDRADIIRRAIKRVIEKRTNKSIANFNHILEVAKNVNRIRQEKNIPFNIPIDICIHK